MNTDLYSKWRCSQCDGESIHGGVIQSSKCRGKATCYHCGEVAVYRAKEANNIVMGQEYRTPWEPSGIVRVTEIGDHYGQKMARVVYVDDHPSGYPAGSVGAYFCNELKPLGLTENAHEPE